MQIRTESQTRKQCQRQTQTGTTQLKNRHLHATKAIGLSKVVSLEYRRVGV
jgi:hypothetical protein